MPIKYTATEKLLSEIAQQALEDLDAAYHEMRKHGWHQSDDKNLKLLYLGVDAALKAQEVAYRAALAIRDAKPAPEIDRLPAWTGHTEGETLNISKGSMK